MRPRGFHAIAFFVCLALSGGAARVHAQAVNGTILGTVRDSGGGAIAMARVRATNLDTGVVRTAVSDSSGFFSRVAMGQKLKPR